ncbi:S-adenosyl-L-methionine-dependent methyltransferase [Aspergillus californicus]
MPDSQLVQLAKTVLAHATDIDTYLESNNLPPLSFDLKGPGKFGTIPVPPDLEKARYAALEAGTELVELLRGPTGFFKPTYNGASLQAVSRWDIPNKVPINGEISYTDLSKKCSGIPELAIRSLLRHAIAHYRLFVEPRAGFVAHSPYSRMLVDEPLLADLLWVTGDIGYSTHPHLVDALTKWKDLEPNHCACSHQAGKEIPRFDLLRQDPAVAERFSRAMKAFGVFPRGPFTVIQEDGDSSSRSAPTLKYPWEKLGDALVADVGGSTGHLSIQIARAFPNPNLRFVVQDLPETVAPAEKNLPADLADRIRFMPYSFLTPQTCEADVYMLNNALHNWPEHYVVQILRNQVPALRPGARLIITDGLALPHDGPGSGRSLLAERATRSNDLLMLTIFNAGERSKEDFARILAEADSKFRITSIQHLWDPTVNTMPTGIIEVIFDA